MVSNSRKKAPNKSTLFLLDIKYVSTMFSLDVKVISAAIMSAEKNRREWFSQAKIKFILAVKVLH